jgi:hypothetical protein
MQFLPTEAVAACLYAHLPNFLESGMMTKNPILDELRETRERLLAEAGGTLDGLVDQLQRDERRSDREFFRPRRQTNSCAGAIKPGHSSVDAPPS